MVFRLNSTQNSDILYLYLSDRFKQNTQLLCLRINFLFKINSINIPKNINTYKYIYILIDKPTNLYINR